MMDKRLFLAFTLSGLVVVATPFLFPRAKTPPAPAAAVAGDSQRATVTPPAPAAAAPTAAVGAATQTTAGAGAPASVTAPAPAGTIGAGAASSAAGVPLISAESIAVNTKVSHTHFSTLGAAPFLVELPGFKSLGASKGVVSIYQRNEPLLRYRVLAGNDTIDLSKLTFSAQRATRANGEQEVTFHATSGATDVTLQYAMQDSTYLGTVKATVRGTAAPAFLLVDLPTGFVSQEGDTMGDITSLAYAVKPQKGGAKGIAFRKLDPGEQRLEAGPMFWATAKNKYFIVGMLASEKAPTIAEVKFEGGTRTSKLATRGKATAVLPLAADGTTTFDLYAGPQYWERMRAL